MGAEGGLEDGRAAGLAWEDGSPGACRQVSAVA
jgi:hypothetical protein